MRELNYIIVHHSASPATTTAAQIDAWHRKRGWRGIGYHYVIRQDESGKPVVEKGRAIEERGAHCRPRNADSIGVCLAGDYSTEEPDPQMWAKLVNLLDTLAWNYLIPTDRIIGHREAQPGHTACPGDGIDLDKLRAEVSKRLAGWDGKDEGEDEEIDAKAQTQAGLEAAMAYFGAE